MNTNVLKSHLGQQGPVPRLWNWQHNVTKVTSQSSSKSVPPKWTVLTPVQYSWVRTNDDDGHFDKVLFSALKQTHCAFVTGDSN